VFKDYKLRPLLAEGFLNYGGDPGLALTYKDFLQPGAPFTLPQRISIRVHPEQFQKASFTSRRNIANFFLSRHLNGIFLTMSSTENIRSILWRAIR
jgi:hypothetical protein